MINFMVCTFYQNFKNSYSKNFLTFTFTLIQKVNSKCFVVWIPLNRISPYSWKSLSLKDVLFILNYMWRKKISRILEKQKDAKNKTRPHLTWASLVAQLVKNRPAMWETWIWALDWEDLLAKGKATHSSILAWRLPWGR